MGVGFGVLIGLSIAVPTYIQSGPLSLSVHRAIMADNFTTSVLGLVTMVVLFVNIDEWRNNWTWRDRRLAIMATFMLIGALVVHRAIWLPWRSMLAIAEMFVDKDMMDASAVVAAAAESYRDSWAQLTTLPQGVWWGALVLFATPVYRRWFGAPSVPWVACAFVALLWIIGYQLPDFVR